MSRFWWKKNLSFVASCTLIASINSGMVLCAGPCKDGCENNPKFNYYSRTNFDHIKGCEACIDGANRETLEVLKELFEENCCGGDRINSDVFWWRLAEFVGRNFMCKRLGENTQKMLKLISDRANECDKDKVYLSLIQEDRFSRIAMTWLQCFWSKFQDDPSRGVEIIRSIFNITKFPSGQ